MATTTKWDIRFGEERREVDFDHPWPGLHSYTGEFESFFFGRAEEIRGLTRRVLNNRVTALIGKSGLGKTSLLEAGLLPRLRQRGLDVVAMRLKVDPERTRQVPLAEQFREALCTEYGLKGEEGDGRPGLWALTHRKDNVERLPSERQIVCVFDQFEEVFERHPSVTRAIELDDFMEQLGDLTANRPDRQLEARFEEGSEDPDDYDHDFAPFHILLSLREDYLSQLFDYTGAIPGLFAHLYKLHELDSTEALHAVLGPARLGGVSLIDDDDAGKLVRFASRVRGQEGEGFEDLKVYPPFLSLLCQQLNLRRFDPEGKTTQEKIHTEDVVPGVLDEIVDSYYHASFSGIPRKAQRLLEDRLVSGERRISASAAALRAQFEKRGLDPGILKTLEQRRLLTVTRHRRGEEHIELSHDILVRAVELSRRQREQRHGRLAAGLVLVMALVAVVMLVLYSGEREQRVESQEELLNEQERTRESMKRTRESIQIREVDEAERQRQKAIEAIESVLSKRDWESLDAPRKDLAISLFRLYICAGNPQGGQSLRQTDMFAETVRRRYDEVGLTRSEIEEKQKKWVAAYPDRFYELRAVPAANQRGKPEGETGWDYEVVGNFRYMLSLEPADREGRTHIVFHYKTLDDDDPKIVEVWSEDISDLAPSDAQRRAIVDGRFRESVSAGNTAPPSGAKDREARIVSRVRVEKLGDGTRWSATADVREDTRSEPGPSRKEFAEVFKLSQIYEFSSEGEAELVEVARLESELDEQFAEARELVNKFLESGITAPGLAKLDIDEEFLDPRVEMDVDKRVEFFVYRTDGYYGNRASRADIKEDMTDYDGKVRYFDYVVREQRIVGVDASGREVVIDVDGTATTRKAAEDPSRIVHQKLRFVIDTSRSPAKIWAIELNPVELNK